MTGGWLTGATAADDDPRKLLATLVGADYSARSITAQHSDRAPSVVRAAMARFAPWDSRSATDIGGAWRVVDLGDAGAVRASTWDDAFAAIHSLALRAHEMGAFVVGLGGDHSVTWPLVTALHEHRAGAGTGATAGGAAGRAADAAPRLGILQLDVHHDVRALDDGPSNGTPIRGLLEQCVVAPSDVVQVGIHPFGNRRELTEYCDQQGIHRFGAEDVARFGPASIVRRALRQLRGVDAIHLTVDIDVLDRAFAPGTVAALPGGMTPAQLCGIVELACADPRVAAMDVVEFDPERDLGQVTAYAAANVVVAALASVARRGGTPA